MEYPAGDWGPPANEVGRTKDLGPQMKSSQRKPEVQGPLQGEGGRVLRWP